MQINNLKTRTFSHYSYAIMSDCEKKIILINPSRNPQQYLDYAKKHDAEITGY